MVDIIVMSDITLSVRKFHSILTLKNSCRTEKHRMDELTDIWQYFFFKLHTLQLN